MNKRTFFQAALVLAISAFVLYCVARGFLEESMRRKAARIGQAVKQNTPYAADPLAIRASQLWNVLTIAGIALTVLSVACTVIAIVRGESGWYIILLLLLVFDVTMPMLL